MSFLVAILILIFSFGQTTETETRERRENIYRYLDIRACGNPCVITDDSGGNIELFIEQAKIAIDNNIKIVIDGSCRSACAVLADHARQMVCITPRMEFGFHMGYMWSPHGVFIGRINMLGDHQRDIREWIVRNGGLPHDGYLSMPYSEAINYWPACDARQNIRSNP